jgi:hypothetical protein
MDAFLNALHLSDHNVDLFKSIYIKIAFLVSIRPITLNRIKNEKTINAIFSGFKI